MPDIDNLNIQISANAANANRELNSLIGNIGRLNTAMGRLGGSRLGSFASSMNTFTAAVSRFKQANLNAKDFNSVASALGKMSRIDSGGLSSAAGGINEIASSLRNINGVTFDANGIANMATAISKLGGVKAGSATANLRTLKDDLVSFISGMNSVGSLTFNADSIAQLISSVSKLGGKTATGAAANLKTLKKDLIDFVSGLNQIGSVKFDVAGLGELVSGISKLGGKTAERAATNIPKIAAALQQLMATLAKAPAVNQNVIQLINSIGQLSSQAGKLQRTGGGGGGGTWANLFSGFNKGAGKAKKSSKGLASAIGMLYAKYWLLMRVAGKVKGAIDVSSSLTEVENVINHTFKGARGVIDDFVKDSYSLQNFGLSELMAKQTAGRFQAMSNAMEISGAAAEKANAKLAKLSNGYVKTGHGAADMSVAVTKLAADYASFYDVPIEETAEKMQAIWTGQTRYSIEWAA